MTRRNITSKPRMHLGRTNRAPLPAKRTSLTQNVTCDNEKLTVWMTFEQLYFFVTCDNVTIISLVLPPLHELLSTHSSLNAKCDM